jgi:hypothetical protein
VIGYPIATPQAAGPWRRSTLSTPPTHEELKKALKVFKKRLLLDQAAS